MKFRAELKLSGRNTGIVVPPEVLAALGGGKRPRVRVTLNGFAFSVTPGSMGGNVMIPVSAERRAEAGVEGGNTYDIGIELDATPDTIAPPQDFAEALAGAGLTAAFDALAPSHRKEHVRAITEAKATETRLRRIEKAVATIREKAK
jgi:Bacteriocin-protection, YdeI or OmpD-Associated/Domain of unknown function (DUF1905)